MQCPFHKMELQDAWAKFCKECGEPLGLPVAVEEQQRTHHSPFFPAETVPLLKVNASRLRVNELGLLDLMLSLPGMTLKSAQIDIHSAAFDRSILASILVKPEQSEHVHRRQVKPHLAGHALVNFRLTCVDQEDLPHIFTSAGDITIQRIETSGHQIIQKIEITAEKMQAVDMSGIRFDSFPIEQAGMGSAGATAIWQEILLHPDVPATHTLRERFRRERLVSCPYCTEEIDRQAAYCPQCGGEVPSYLRKKHYTFDVDLSEHPPCLSAKFVFQASKKEVYVFTKPHVTLGRQQGNDIVLRLFPPTEENNQRSRRISRQHAQLLWEREHIRLQTFGPTFIAGEEVKDKILEDGMIIDIGGVLQLKVSLFRDKRVRLDATHAFPESIGDFGTVMDVNAPAEAQPISIGALMAVRLQRLDNRAGREEYLLLKREATIGMSGENPITLSYGGLSQRHARIVFLENQLWLEDLSSSYGSYVNNRKAAGDEIVLLAENSEIRLGDIRFNRVLLG